MEEKITLRLFLMGACAAVLACVFTGTLLLGSFAGQVKHDLRQSAQLVATAYDGDPESLACYAQEDLRLTLIGADGTVLYESSKDASLMDNHSDRPEIRQALQSGSGEAERESDTYLQNLYYYAMRLEDGTVLRACVRAGALYNSFEQAYPYLVVVLIFLALLSVVLAFLLTRKLLRPIRHLAENIDTADVQGQEKNAVYQELAPFVRQIQRQRQQIACQFQQLEEEKAKLSLIIAHMSEGLIVLDQRNRILMANKSAEDTLRLTGRYEGENLLYVSSVEGLREAIEAADAQQGRSVTIKCAGRVLRVFADPVISGGARMGVVLLVVDVTQTQQLERMRQEFTANVSHELKTPLTSISGYAEMIEAGIAREEDVRGFAARIHKEAARMIALIGDIMRLSALDEGAAAHTAERVPLCALCREVVQAQELNAQRHQVHIDVEGDEGCVLGDRTLLRELIHNLVDNAIRYNREGGSVQVSFRDALLSVRDTGIGIAPESRERVFERFYRVDKSRSRETGGTGLGLAIVRHIAQLYGAEVTLGSEVDQGTCVQVRFRAA